MAHLCALIREVLGTSSDEEIIEVLQVRQDARGGEDAAEGVRVGY